MNTDKIAILVDSGVDVPTNIINENENMYVVPLKVIYSYGEFSDGLDITPEEVYESLEQEIPSTSLPSGDDITKVLDQIKADGYNKVLAICISSGLSGTYNAIRVISNDYKDLDVFVLDTKNIGIGSGFNAIQALEHIKNGMNWDKLIETVTNNISNSKVFFCLSTLEYLQKGGRIGLVSSILGSTLSLKPIISCNEEGIYYTASKVIGRKRSLKKTIDLAVDFAGDSKNYNIAVAHGNAKEDADIIKSQILKLLPNSNIFLEGQISPVLGVHTGPGIIGIAIQKL